MDEAALRPQRIAGDQADPLPAEAVVEALGVGAGSRRLRLLAGRVTEAVNRGVEHVAGVALE